MRRVGIIVVMCLSSLGHAQVPLAVDEALKQIYESYDSIKNTAILTCTGDQAKNPSEWWPCYKEDSVASVEVLLSAVVTEDATKMYLVTSAIPAHDPMGFDCHSCQPVIGVAVFVYKSPQWLLESVDPVIGRFGAWGSPPTVELLTIGTEHHGILLTSEFGGQGYESGYKYLLAPVGKTVREVWSLVDEQDNSGAYDPKGIDGPAIQYRSSAAVRFDCIFKDSCANGSGYFDIEVISRGRDEVRSNKGDNVVPTFRLQQENWTDVYQFKDGEYKLARHQKFIETKAVPVREH
jgi:hypothetical protein